MTLTFTPLQRAAAIQSVRALIGDPRSGGEGLPAMLVDAAFRGVGITVTNTEPFATPTNTNAVHAAAAVRHFAPYGSTNAACHETLPHSVARDLTEGEYADDRFTTRRARTTCHECRFRAAIGSAELEAIQAGSPADVETADAEWEWNVRDPEGCLLRIMTEAQAREVLDRDTNDYWTAVKRPKGAEWQQATPAVTPSVDDFDPDGS